MALPLALSAQRTVQRVTEAYLGLMVDSLAADWNVPTEQVAEVVAELHHMVGSPAIYVHRLDGVRSFEGGPLKAMFIERDIYQYGSPVELVEIFCAEGAHTLQWHTRPWRTGWLMSLAYGRATVMTWREAGFLKIFRPYQVQQRYDTFAYGPDETIWSRNEIEAHGQTRILGSGDFGLEGALLEWVIARLEHLAAEG